VAGLRGKALVAYLLVCVFWGSTYLAIRVGVADLPPFLFAGTRFVIAGGLLLAISLALGGTLPRDWTSWRIQGTVGLFLLLGGNTFVVWAEQFTDSGVASIFVVTVALWMALFDALVPGSRSRLSARVVAGLALGFAGTILLIGATPREIVGADLRGPGALTLASASWAFGSVWFKRQPSHVGNPYVAASMQMLVGGAAVTLVGLALGEAGEWRATPAGLGAMAYLIVFGSIVGYTSYFYALRHAPPTIVGTYAYVNPVIAVLLGWLLLDEALSPRTFVAMALILSAVAWIQLSHRFAAPPQKRRISAGVEGPPDDA
jgi:drug/metabolite transporter (DMT)-like permease